MLIFLSGFLERLKDGDNIVIGEGYTFELERRGYIKNGVFTPEVLLSNPEQVKSLHEEYVHNGSDVVQSFTVSTVYSFVCPSVCRSVCLSVCLSICKCLLHSRCYCLTLSKWNVYMKNTFLTGAMLFKRLLLVQFIALCVCTSVCLSVCLSVRLSASVIYTRDVIVSPRANEEFTWRIRP